MISALAYIARAAVPCSRWQSCAPRRMVPPRSELALRRSVAPKMAALKPPETAEEERRWDPASRARFDALHRLYVRLYTSNLFLSLAALVVSVLQTR